MADQVTRLPVDPVRADPKEGLSQLAALKRKNTQALSFQLGAGGYPRFATSSSIALVARSTACWTPAS